MKNIIKQLNTITIVCLMSFVMTDLFGATPVKTVTYDQNNSIVSPKTTISFPGTITANSYTTRTNSWALDTPITWGTNALVLLSGAATGGITGISGFKTSEDGSVGLLIKASGDIVFTNVANIECSDFLDSRTITNGNSARIGITLTPGVCTNMDIVQYK